MAATDKGSKIYQKYIINKVIIYSRLYYYHVLLYKKYIIRNEYYVFQIK